MDLYSILVKVTEFQKVSLKTPGRMGKKSEDVLDRIGLKEGI